MVRLAYKPSSNNSNIGLGFVSVSGLELEPEKFEAFKNSVISKLSDGNQQVAQMLGDMIQYAPDISDSFDIPVPAEQNKIEKQEWRSSLEKWLDAINISLYSKSYAFPQGLNHIINSLGDYGVRVGNLKALKKQLEKEVSAKAAKLPAQQFLAYEQ